MSTVEECVYKDKDKEESMSATKECLQPSNNDQLSATDNPGIMRKTLDKVRLPVENKVKKQFTRLARVGSLVVNVWVAVSLTLASSVFLYATFYYTYMPGDTHEADLNFGFSSCGDSVGLCSFPNATTSISRRNQNLMPGQRYSFSLVLEVPDSPSNQDLGMFMSCLSLQDKSHQELNKICRSSILEYRSELLRVIETFVLFPFLLTGWVTQRQWVRVYFYNDFVDNTHNPAKTANINLQSKFIQVYSGQLRVAANLSGLRSMMYHHPWLAATMGISLNIAVISVLVILSWTRLSRTRQLVGRGSVEEEGDWDAGIKQQLKEKKYRTD